MHTDNSWKKNLYPLFLSQFFYRAGTRSLIPILPLFIKELAGNDVETTVIWSGWIFACPFIISFFMTPFWGSIGDKYGRKLTTLLSIGGFLLSNILMSFSSSLYFLLFAAATQELFGGAYPAAVSLTAANSPKEKTTDALSYLQFANALGNVVGPFFGGIVADLLGYNCVFLITALVVFVTSIPILFLVKEKNVERNPELHSLANNVKYFFNRYGLIVCGILLLSYTLSLTMMRPNFTLFIQTYFGNFPNQASISGLLFGLFGGAGTISAAMLPSIKKKFSDRNTLAFAFSLSALGFLSLNLAGSIYIFALLLVITGFSIGIILPLVYSLISHETEQKRKAGVMGIGSSFQMAGNLAGPIIAGYFVSLFGLNFSFAVSGIILAGAIIFYKIEGKNDKAVGKETNQK